MKSLHDKQLPLDYTEIEAQDLPYDAYNLTMFSLRGEVLLLFFTSTWFDCDSDFKNFETVYFTVHCYNICLLKFQNSCNYHFYSYILPQTRYTLENSTNGFCL